ncbi:hypothetical protein LIR39_07330 [Streptococcus sp. MSK15_114]|uniref:hypothetical protein n=1 Tax=Streptococcus sp. MSK15_114 TaxID=2883191 RepID=UPI002234F23E|nr:hypothetical protein [Streptococcus sp. MSK15_114]MCB5733573.1 hypothetical protein [Streptococcus sp. MSK15_114]
MYLSKKDISEWIANLKAGDEVAIQRTRMDGIVVSSERGIVDKWLGKRLIVVDGKHFVPSTGLRQSNSTGQKTIVEQLFPLDALLLDEEELSKRDTIIQNLKKSAEFIEHAQNYSSLVVSRVLRKLSVLDVGDVYDLNELRSSSNTEDLEDSDLLDRRKLSEKKRCLKTLDRMLTNLSQDNTLGAFKLISLLGEVASEFTDAENEVSEC